MRAALGAIAHGGSCPRAASGHAAAAPTRAMKPRRLISNTAIPPLAIKLACALRSWTRMLFGRGAGNPLLRGSCGFRPVRGCRNDMNDLVAAAF